MDKKKPKKEQATTISVDKDTMIIVDELKKKLRIKNASELMRMAVREKYERDVNLGIDLPSLYTQFKEFKTDVYKMLMNRASLGSNLEQTTSDADKKVEAAILPFTKLIEESTRTMLAKLDANDKRYKEIEKSLNKVSA